MQLRAALMVTVVALFAPVASGQTPAPATPTDQDGFAPYVAPTPPPANAPVSEPPVVDAPVSDAPVVTVEPRADAPHATFPAPTRRLNRLTWGPLLFLGGFVPIEYERAVGERVSVYVGPEILAFSPLSLVSDSSLLTLNVAVGARYFPLDLAPEGLWFAGEFTPGYSYTRTPSQTFAGQSVVDSRVSATLLAMIGYTYIAEYGLTASVGFGIGGAYTMATIREGNSVQSTALPSPQIGIHANVGWAF